MSFKFEKKLTNEEQKELSADDQKTYILGLLKSQGVDDAEVGALDEPYMLPTGGGVDPADGAGALPPTEQRPLAATQTEEEDHSDLPPSIRGELGNLDDVDPVVPSVKEGEEVQPASDALVSASIRLRSDSASWSARSVACLEIRSSSSRFLIVRSFSSIPLIASSLVK